MMKQRWAYDGLTVTIAYRAEIGVVMYKKIKIRYDEKRNSNETQGAAIVDSLIINAEKSAPGLQIVGRTYKVNHRKVYESA